MAEGHGTFTLLVRDDSGESQQTDTVIVDDELKSEVTPVYDSKPVEVEESFEDCE